MTNSERWHYQYYDEAAKKWVYGNIEENHSCLSFAEWMQQSLCRKDNLMYRAVTSIYLEQEERLGDYALGGQASTSSRKRKLVTTIRNAIQSIQNAVDAIEAEL